MLQRQITDCLKVKIQCCLKHFTFFSIPHFLFDDKLHLRVLCIFVFFACFPYAMTFRSVGINKAPYKASHQARVTSVKGTTQMSVYAGSLIWLEFANIEENMHSSLSTIATQAFFQCSQNKKCLCWQRRLSMHTRHHHTIRPRLYLQFTPFHPLSAFAIAVYTPPFHSENCVVVFFVILNLSSGSSKLELMHFNNTCNKQKCL